MFGSSEVIGWRISSGSWNAIRKRMYYPQSQSPGAKGITEPVGGKVVDTVETPSTWLFMTRTSLREHLNGNFRFVTDGTNPTSGNLNLLDTGGKILAQMRDASLGYAIMPPWYRVKYHHFGSLTSRMNEECASKEAAPSQHRSFKEAQHAFIRKNAINLTNGRLP